MTSDPLYRDGRACETKVRIRSYFSVKVHRHPLLEFAALLPICAPTERDPVRRCLYQRPLNPLAPRSGEHFGLGIGSMLATAKCTVPISSPQLGCHIIFVAKPISTLAQTGDPIASRASLQTVWLPRHVAQKKNQAPRVDTSLAWPRASESQSAQRAGKIPRGIASRTWSRRPLHASWCLDRGSPVIPGHLACGPFPSIHLLEFATARKAKSHRSTDSAAADGSRQAPTVRRSGRWWLKVGSQLPALLGVAHVLGVVLTLGPLLQ